MITEEQWKDVPGYENYKVSSTGRIIGSKGKLLSPSITADGYYRVSLYKNYRHKSKSVHSVVALAFIGERPDGYHIEHINHDKSNNSIYNIRYCTPRENYDRGLSDNLYGKGVDHSRVKLSEDEVIEIYNNKLSQRKLAKEYGISQNMVHRIKSGKNWSHVTIACQALSDHRAGVK